MHIVSITGASGPILGIRLIEELLRAGKEVTAIVSESAWKVIHHEMYSNKTKPASIREIINGRGKTGNIKSLKEYRPDDLFAPPASGTTLFEAIIVIPCSMKTLAGIAAGYADNLINRAVDVALKEGRKCILVPRETPLNLLHIENLLKVKQAGAIIHMPVPSFYTFPESLEDVINFIIGKTLNLLDIKHELFCSWGEGRYIEK